MLNKETSVSMQIKVLSEVEKMWIMYDKDGSGSVDYDEIVAYLNEISKQKLNLTND